VLFRCGSEIGPDAARVLTAAGTRAVGIDSLSIGDAETHRILLHAGVWIIEGLDLSSVEPGRYELICLPLKIEGADGAPARALLRALI
jgi:arylformamidase